MGRNLVANKEAVARANTIKNIIGVPKDVKISGLNNAILSTKFSNNDTAMIKKIAEKISQNKPLTEIQTKNLITIKKLIEEKLPQSEVGKFRQFLPNKDIGKGLTSINKKEPIVAMNVSNKNNIKTPFTHTTPIKNTLTEVEQKYFNAIKNIKTKKNSEQIEVAEVPEFL